MSTKGRASSPVHFGVESWVRENEKHFLPPVCNKMMHNTQLKVFFVGGPNVRKDYHLEEGEELFYMRKGDMCLKIQEGGKFVDVPIKEGEVFLLPGKIPHSPQRQADTVGLVVEREREAHERDGLRYHVEGSSESLYERWFYCDDLGTQLGPVIRDFFASEQHRTGRPVPGDNPTPCWEPDSNRRIEWPFSLDGWLQRHSSLLQETGRAKLFCSDRYQSDVSVLGGTKEQKGLKSEGGETLLWTIRGGAKITVRSGGQSRSYSLGEDEMLLLPCEAEFDFTPGTGGGGGSGSACMAVRMDPNTKGRVVNKG